MKKPARTISLLSLVSLLACFSGATNAAEANTTTIPVQLHTFKLKPRISIWGLSGNYSIGRGQILFPLSSDQNHALFTIAEADAANTDTWYAGVGLGYRQIVSDRIYGGYLTADYNRSHDHNSFGIINPGIEILGKTWDFNANAYIATSRKKIESSTIKWADELDIHDYIFFHGHNQYNRRVQCTDFESAGQGVDVKIGRIIPGIKNAKIYLGGYYFKAKDNGNVTGGLAKITYNLNQYAALEATNYYDNYNHNKLLLGVKLTLGGYSPSEQQEFGLSSRLLDPIERGYSSTIIPLKKTRQSIRMLDTAPVLQYDNIWFFTPTENNTAEYNSDGTFEHAFTKFTPDTFQYVVDHYTATGKNLPKIYLEGPATISLSKFIGAPQTNDQPGLQYKLLIPQNISLYGREDNFKQAAQNNRRPTLIGGIDFYNSGHNILDSIIIHETGERSRGAGIITLKNSTDVTFKNILVGAEQFATGGYNTGVYLQNSALELQGVEIFALNDNYAATNYVRATGIYANNSTLSFNGGKNLISVRSSSLEQQNNGRKNYSIYANGIYAISSTINFIHGENAINSMSIAAASSAKPLKTNLYLNATGIENNNSQTNFIGGNNNVAATTINYGNNQYLSEAYGIEIRNTAKSQQSSATINPSQINFLGGFNQITADNKAAREAALAEKPTFSAYGISVNSNSTKSADSITFTGGINTITANNDIYGETLGLSAAGLFLNNENLLLTVNGGINTIHSQNHFVTEKAEDSTVINATGILAHGGQIYFNRGINTIRAENYGTNTFFSLSSAGLRLYDTTTLTPITVVFNGGKNSIGAKNYVSNLATLNQQGSLSLDTYGIISINSNYNSLILFSGGTNTISAENIAQGNYDERFITTTGLATSSNLIFSGGDNLFTAITHDNTNAQSEQLFHLNHTTGIKLLDGTADFQNTSKVKIVVGNYNNASSNRAVYGIDAFAQATIKVDHQQITELKELLDYTNITLLPNSTYAIGSMMAWYGHQPIDWSV